MKDFTSFDKIMWRNALPLVSPDPDHVGPERMDSDSSSGREAALTTSSDEDQPSLTLDTQAGPRLPSPPSCTGILDIGCLVNALMSPDEVKAGVESLTEQIYQHLTSHFVSPMGYKFPDTYMNKCNGSFQQKWLSK